MSHSMDVDKDGGLGESKPLLGTCSSRTSLNDNTPSEPNRSKCRGFSLYVEPILFFFMCALFAQMPLVMQYLYQEIASENNFTYSNSDDGSAYCKNTSGSASNMSDHDAALREKVQGEAAQWMLYMSLAGGLPGFIMTALLGPYSDKIGRKLVLFVPLLGSSVKISLYMVIVYFNLAKEFLILGSFLEGCCGSWATVIMAAMAYLADITTKRQRAIRILILESSMALAGVISSLLMGFWIQESYFYPFIFVLGCYVFCMVFIVFIVPESIPAKTENKRISFFTLDSIKGVYRVYTMKRPNVTKGSLLYLLLILMLAAIVMTASRIDTLYLLNTPFCWTSILIGYYTAISCVIIQVTNIVGMKLFIMIGINDAGIMIIAFVSAVIGYMVRGLASSTLVMYIALVAGMLRMLVIPMLRAVMSKMVSPFEQGTLFAGIAIMENIMSTVGDALWSGIYSATVSVFAGTAYMGMAGVCTVAALLCGLYLCLFKQQSLKHDDTKQSPKEKQEEVINEKA